MPGFVRGEGGTRMQQHRATIQSRLHRHHGDPRFRITGQDGSLDRRRPPVPWQQGGMQVPTAEPGQIQHRLWDNLSVGHHNDKVRLQSSDQIHVLPQTVRLEDGNPLLQRQNLGGRGGQDLFPAHGFVGLADQSHHLDLRMVQQAGQSGHRDVSGAQKKCSGAHPG